MEKISAMYDEGLINKDFAVMDSAKWNDPVVKGKAGVIVDTGSRASQIQSAMEEADPGNKDVIDVIGTVKGPKGTYTFPTSGYAGMIAIPKASVKTEKELKEVLGFLDKMNDEEAQIIANNGVKGRNYKLENGAYTSLEKNNKKLLYEHEGLAQFSMGIPRMEPEKGRIDVGFFADVIRRKHIAFINELRHLVGRRSPKRASGQQQN